MSIGIPIAFSYDQFRWPGFDTEDPDPSGAQFEDLKNLPIPSPETMREKVAGLAKAYVYKNLLLDDDKKVLGEILKMVVDFAEELTKSVDLGNFIKGDSSTIIQKLTNVNGLEQDFLDQYILDTEGENKESLVLSSGDYDVKLEAVSICSDSEISLFGNINNRWIAGVEPTGPLKAHSNSDVTISYTLRPKGEEKILANFYVTYCGKEKKPKITYVDFPTPGQKNPLLSFALKLPFNGSFRPCMNVAWGSELDNTEDFIDAWQTD